MDRVMGQPVKRTKTSSFGTNGRAGHDASKFYGQRLYQDFNIATSKKKAGRENTPEQLDIIHLGDSRDMNHLPDNSVHLMITSPPYNVGKDYDADLTLTEYEDLLFDVMTEVYRVLVEGGRVCINIANVGRSPYIPLHLYLTEIAHSCGFFMRGEIIWDKGASAGTSCAWGSWQSSSNPVLRDVHEYILVFCKGTFKRHPVLQNSIGRDDFLESTKSIWRFPSASAKRANHPAPFPVELPLRLIHLYSYVGDTVLDPFIGSGTTAEAAVKTGRRYVGYEINEKYVDVARARMESLNSGTALP
jgi:DNA modification methylase